MRDADTAPSPGLLTRLAAAWRFLTSPVQADFAGVAPAIEAADREDEQRGKENAGEATAKGENDFAHAYRWMPH
ncbi:hypothetical protein [Rhabdaerophilum sp.]|uniref:hypothetical protein n=1 Tax=Rhabdaerophilum sp. TaxID=2717341 RepID=UPI0038D422DB